MKYPAIIERTGPDTYCAYSPDVPGCVATGHDPGQLRQDFLGLLRNHLKYIRLANGEVPLPSTEVCTVDIEDGVA
jgi:predicted RNase H-like HicB family nuclease